MKKIFFALVLGVSFVSFSQEEDEIVPFAIIEKVPVYPGCDENMSSQSLKDCMSSSVSSFVTRNFNIKMAQGLGLSDGKQRIFVSFKIDKTGEIIDIMARAPHPELEKEAVRVINLLPKMDRPGYIIDKPVIVPYSLPIVFKLESKVLSKREKRRLERQKMKATKN